MSIKPETIEKQAETRCERFVRVAERRVNYILDNLDSLSKCSNRGNYEYGVKDIEAIFKAIEGKVREVKAAFVGSNTKGKKRFRLDGSKS